MIAITAVVLVCCTAIAVCLFRAARSEYPTSNGCCERLVEWIHGERERKREIERRLSSAAPELLEACQAAKSTIDEMLDVIGNDCDPWSADNQRQWHGFCETYDLLSTTIKKAEAKSGR